MAELLRDAGDAEDSHYSNLNVGDALYAIFKHKWKILLCAIAGLLVAAYVQITWTPIYESHAKLLVRYVLERTPIDPDANSQKMALNVIGSEVEILTSWDLALAVAEALGPKRLLPHAPNPTVTDAAGTVAGGLRVFPGGGANIIFVAYSNRDPDLARLVLDELVNRYFTKHLEVHRSAGAFDFVTQQTDQVRARLNETEDALRALKSKAGIVSFNDSMGALSGSMARIEEQLQNQEEELADQTTLVKALEQAPAAASDPKRAPRPAVSKDVQNYQAVAGRLERLRHGELDLLAKYTPDNVIVKFHQKQIADLEKQKAAMEDKFPELAATTPGAPQPTLAGEKARLAAMQARVERLRTRLTNVREGIRKLSEYGSQLADLERNQELEVANYKYFKNTLEKARIDEALDPSKMPNISAVQRPTPPARVFGKRDKMVMAFAGGGIGGAIGLTLLLELFLSQTVKRPLELEKRLGTRLLISIPDCKRNGSFRLPWKKNGSNAKNGKNGLTPSKGARAVPPWEIGHFIRPYSEAIRDRLGLYFELNRMTHKPKLVGVTAFKEGSGTSTLAAGLAAAFSEMGEGKVLLVDVNLGPGDVHPFFNGRPALSLTAALQPNDGVPAAAENLYLAAVGNGGPHPAQLGLKKFFDLMPNLKASDFDYIIFDMPPLSQTSPTLGMAGFMDKILLVVEAEKNGRETVKRGYDALIAGRDNVSVVFNKARSYTPEWLHSDS
ncbi:MAG TPA: Wzz/FepE/Etk N-terminal domain-containing protein [Chthoniobacterales bacterium]